MNANLTLDLSTNANLGWLSYSDKLSEVETEKRRYPRYQAQQDVICSVYDHANDDFEIFEAQVENRSEIGLLLTTNRQLEIGTPILVRLKHFTGKDAKDELKDGLHAQVVRCDAIFNLEERPFYKAAIEYFELGHSY